MIKRTSLMNKTAGNPCWMMCVVFCGLAVLAAPARGQGTLHIRLIAASNNGQGISGALSDVQGLLQSNLPFQRFDLLDQARVALPADRTVSMARGIRVHCVGHTGQLHVRVSREGHEVVNTTLRLREFRPVILGGFPHQQGRLLLVLVAQ